MPFDAEYQAEVERSQKTAARLLESLSLKLRVEPTVRQAAEFVKRRSVRKAAREIQPFLRPAAAMLAALAAGYALGRILRKT